MAEAGARQVDAIDIAPEAITLARQRYARPEVRFAVGDLLSLTAGEHYDVVVSFETIEHIADTERFLQVLRDALKPGGLLFLSTPNRTVWNPRATRFDQPRNPFHRFELTRDELARLLRAHFRVEEIYGQHPYYYKGTRIRTTQSILASPYLRRMLHLRRADYWKLSQVRPIRSYHESAYLVARCSKQGGL
jgi:SAM-dependent methyltransferase